MELLKKKSVLIVDDDEMLRDTLHDILKPHTQKILLADNGIKALDVLNENPVDVTLLDINMPEMDGFELLGKIRWNYPKILNIVISGDAMGALKKEDILFQGYNFLLKPFNKRKLLEVINTALKIHAHRKVVVTGEEKKIKKPAGVRIKKKEKSEKIVYDRKMKGWMSHYKQLIGFRKSNPDRWPKFREIWRRKNIGYWCSIQRNLYKKRSEGNDVSLSEEQIKLLDDISFKWSSDREVWMEKYDKLVKFKGNNPDRWPNCWGEEQKLGVWCSFQRTQYKKFKEGEKNFLDQQKIDLLNKLEFPWVLNKK